MQKYPTKQDKELIEGFSKLKNEKQIAGFLRDLLTPAEIEEFSSRFQVAKLLWTTNDSYLDIAQKVNTSTTTITRVSHWLYKEPYQGYSSVLEKMFGKSKR
ncbi:MAG: transcriptional regulator [Candidatus Pacebacteria bacterium CG_4_9_14_0_2_um_filter_34_50]|nr:MAG: transcriptional regulator [Candidatus Pacebacteria bacterium CG_4_9_14_0_2_um_filter_34_50]